MKHTIFVNMRLLGVGGRVRYGLYVGDGIKLIPAGIHTTENENGRKVIRSANLLTENEYPDFYKNRPLNAG